MLRHALAILALLLFLAVITLWIDSSSHYLDLSRATPDSHILLAACAGRFRIVRYTRPDPPYVDDPGPPPHRACAGRPPWAVSDYGSSPWSLGWGVIREPCAGTSDETYWLFWQRQFRSVFSCSDYCTYTRHPGGWVTISGHILGETIGSDAEINYPCHAIEASLAWPTALLALPAALGIQHFVLQLKRYRRRRKEPTLCPTCAYDLRAHQPGQKCPECGTPIARPNS